MVDSITTIFISIIIINFYYSCRLKTITHIAQILLNYIFILSCNAIFITILDLSKYNSSFYLGFNISVYYTQSSMYGKTLNYIFDLISYFTLILNLRQSPILKDLKSLFYQTQYLSELYLSLTNLIRNSHIKLNQLLFSLLLLHSLCNNVPQLLHLLLFNKLFIIIDYHQLQI